MSRWLLEVVRVRVLVREMGERDRGLLEGKGRIHLWEGRIEVIRGCASLLFMRESVSVPIHCFCIKDVELILSSDPYCPATQ